MLTIRVETSIDAPPESVFDVARSISVHAESMRWTGERIVECPPHDLLELGDTITFEGIHFGVRQQLGGKITELARPERFVDTMVRGAFKRLTHRHDFVRTGNTSCRMIDIMEFEAPWGLIGRAAERLLLEKYMRRLLERRALAVKQTAEKKHNSIQGTIQ